MNYKFDNAEYEPYFGFSRSFEKIKENIGAAAQYNCAVLILGESGTGKGVIARWIHNNSPRSAQAFVDINCSGFSGELLRSELFGHAAGAFTGAIRDRQGLIEEADGGTLFLDEIGNMDIGLQCMLLKTIEEKTYRRIGENKMRTSNFRLICATNRDLPDAVKKGAFREDLYYRINTMAISIPPLRARKEDIPGLANSILEMMGYDRFPVRGDVMDTLMRRYWHGNIRELRNALENAMVFARGDALSPEHFSSLNGAAEFWSDSRAELVWAREDPWNLDDLENAHIKRALEYFGNNKVKVSAALGIAPSSLYRKLKATR